MLPAPDYALSGPGDRRKACLSRLALAILALSLIAAPVAAADDSREAWAALVNGSLVALVPLPGNRAAAGARSSRQYMGRGSVRQEPGTARGVEADGVQLARTGHARGGDSRPDGSSTGRYHAGPGRDRGAQTQAWRRAANRCCGQDTWARVTFCTRVPSRRSALLSF